MDAATPATPSLLASTAPEGGASVACCPLMADGSKLYTCLCDGSSHPQVVAMDPSSGAMTTVGRFSPQLSRAQYAGVVAGADFYWTDRIPGGDGGVSCPIYATSTAGGTTGAPLVTANADVYPDGAVLLADAANLYLLADSVSGLPATAAPVQLLRIARDTGAITLLDTGGAEPVFQFTQDANAVYIAVDTDVTQGAGVERVSRVVQFPKNGGPSTTLHRIR